MMTNTPQWSYYIMFEFENSDGKKVVKKMMVSGKEYKRICEGDCWDLTFQTPPHFLSIITSQIQYI